MKDEHFATQPACLDGSSDARLSLEQDGVRAARTPWRRPELKALAVEETKTGTGVFQDGSASRPHPHS